MCVGCVAEQNKCSGGSLKSEEGELRLFETATFQQKVLFILTNNRVVILYFGFYTQEKRKSGWLDF